MSPPHRNRSPSPPSRPSKRRRSPSPPPSPPLPSFPSHLSTPNLPPKILHLCSLLSSSPPSSLLSLLNSTPSPLSQSEVESVLRLSYSHPGPALTFFRWAAEARLSHSHSPYAWNLVVDLLGKNRLFAPMWDAVRSMRDLNMLSLATFASVFASLAGANRAAEALATFMALPSYGVRRDVVALNALLSALCRAGRSEEGRAVVAEAGRLGVRADRDSFAILMEGYEGEGDDLGALKVLDDMVCTIGWDPANIQAYDSFLTTMITSAPNGVREALHYLEIMGRKGCSPGLKFFRAAIKLCADKSDERAASLLWEDYIRPGNFALDVSMCNSMIRLLCGEKCLDKAVSCFEEMVPRGAFPNEDTYNILFQGLLKGQKLKEAERIFNEMTKNEHSPTESDCYHALKLSIDEKEPDMAINYWLCMVKNKMEPIEESGNLLVVSLCDEMDRLPEACKYIEFMIESGIRVSNVSLGKVKKGLEKVRKGEIYERISKKWREGQK